MDLAVPLPINKIDAANRLHERLEQWRLADQALRLLADRCPDFELAACLLKVVAVNELYGTNLYATTRMAKHAAGVLADTNLAAAGPELVERLADLPATEGQKRKRRHYSFASKFAHFFLDDERFPIMDSYAVKMLKRHLGRQHYSDDTAQPYASFVSNFHELKRLSGFAGSNRQLDRYLWLAGEYAAWKKKPGAAINAEVATLFAQPSGEVAALLGTRQAGTGGGADRRGPALHAAGRRRAGGPSGISRGLLARHHRPAAPSGLLLGRP